MRNFINTALVILIASMAVACAKQPAPAPSPEDHVAIAGNNKIEVALEGIIDGYAPEAESKASAENVIRIMWQGGEMVYVYEGKDYLGTLTASTFETDGIYAKLFGTIDKPSGGKAITLVYSPDFSDRPDEEGRISFDLSSQSAKDVPFLIYGVVDSLEGTTDDEESSEISNKVVNFKLATSVFKCNCADLPVEGTISNVSIGPVNTECVITLSDEDKPTIGGSTPGTITRTTGFTAADSRLIFSVAMAPDNDGQPRTINVTKGGTDYDAAFSKTALEAAKAYNSVFVFKPVGALPGKFTVNPYGGTVYFSRGNLWFDRDKYYTDLVFHLESNQWTEQAESHIYWNPSHVRHVYWSKSQVAAGGESYSDSGRSASDVFFTNSTPISPDADFTVNIDGVDQTGVWRTLSGGEEDGEWYYLLEMRKMVYDKPRYTNLTSGVTIEGATYKGLFIYPDDYNRLEIGVKYMSPSTWAEIDAAGIVFLPALGYRTDTSLNENGSYGFYWSGTADDNDDAFCLAFNNEGVSCVDSERYFGYSVRLVRDYR